MIPETPPPNVILLTSNDLEHQHVAARLLEAIPSLEIIVEPRKAGPRKGGAKRAMRHGIFPLLQKILRTVFLRVINDQDRRTAALRRHLPDSPEIRDLMDQGLQTPTINSQEVIDRINEAKPVCVLVYGTGLVRRPVIEAAGSRVLNLHTGLSPFYRGVACYLWPLVDGRFDQLGVTVHDCVLRLDAGGILGTSTVDPDRGDGVHDVFARLVKSGAELYAELARQEVDDSPVARVKQDLEAGREYRGWQLGFTTEFRARWNLRRFLALKSSHSPSEPEDG